MSRILLIEPDLILARTYATALETAGHEVYPVSSAQSGIMVADDKNPDLVILEIQLIKHSGIEFLYEFRSYQEWQSIPVIVLSQVPPGEFNDSWQLLKNELGVGPYLYKPLTTLKQLINNVAECSLVSS